MNFSVLAVEKNYKLFITPKYIFSQFWTNEKYVEKIGEYKLRGLLVRCHELIEILERFLWYSLTPKTYHVKGEEELVMN